MMKLHPGKRLAAAIFLAVGMAIVSTGCAKHPAEEPVPPPQPTAPAYIEHVVKASGETLAVIAQWYTGDAMNWRKLVDANPGLVPERMRIGQVIRIPRALVVQDKPFPRKAVAKTTTPEVTTPKEDSVTQTEAPAPTSTKSETVSQPTTPPPAHVAEPAPSKPAVTESAPTDTKQPVALPAATPAAQPTPAAAKPARKGEEGLPQSDAEREKLLEELLQQ